MPPVSSYGHLAFGLSPWLVLDKLPQALEVEALQGRHGDGTQSLCSHRAWPGDHHTQFEDAQSVHVSNEKERRTFLSDRGMEDVCWLLAQMGFRFTSRVFFQEVRRTPLR